MWQPCRKSKIFLQYFLGKFCYFSAIFGKKKYLSIDSLTKETKIYIILFYFSEIKKKTSLLAPPHPASGVSYPLTPLPLPIVTPLVIYMSHKESLSKTLYFLAKWNGPSYCLLSHNQNQCLMQWSVLYLQQKDNTTIPLPKAVLFSV